MRQQLKFSPTLSDMAFPMIEVDADIVTVKMFIDVFKGEDGPVDPAATPPITHFMLIIVLNIMLCKDIM